MANTTQKNIGYAGLYTRTRDYLLEKTALFGLIKWEEVVKTTQLDNDLILKIDTMQTPTVVYMNGEEYKLIKLTDGK